MTVEIAHVILLWLSSPKWSKCSHAGVTFVGRLIKSTGRTSIIVILLTALITVRPSLVFRYLLASWVPGTRASWAARVCWFQSSFDMI